VLAVLGTCHLDMRRSFVESDGQLRMKVTVVFGSATFLLPDGAEVRPSGVSFLASSLVDVPEHEQEPELPTVGIEWTCMFGRLRIVTEQVLAAPEPEPEPRADELIGGAGGTDASTPADREPVGAGVG
jgi:hypothetical protein